eukprot:GHVS01037908.1.p1 GENE.GHVS01037908.1~~GHVS01037908.1.p1  ORF type:complete len:258 (-),score=42.53 GHVS01037908.1:171-881(-)
MREPALQSSPTLSDSTSSPSSTAMGKAATSTPLKSSPLAESTSFTTTDTGGTTTSGALHLSSTDPWQSSPTLSKHTSSTTDMDETPPSDALQLSSNYAWQSSTLSESTSSPSTQAALMTGVVTLATWLVIPGYVAFACGIILLISGRDSLAFFIIGLSQLMGLASLVADEKLYGYQKLNTVVVGFQVTLIVLSNLLLVVLFSRMVYRRVCQSLHKKGRNYGGSHSIEMESLEDGRT